MSGAVLFIAGMAVGAMLTIIWAALGASGDGK
jgi:hypothetical protein